MESAGGRLSPAAYMRATCRRYALGAMHSPIEGDLPVMPENFGVFSWKIGPGFRAENSPGENVSSEYILQIPLVQGVLRGNKKSPVRGLDRAKNQNWGGRWDLNPRPPGPQPGALTN